MLRLTGRTLSGDSLPVLLCLPFKRYRKVIDLITEMLRGNFKPCWAPSALGMNLVHLYLVHSSDPQTPCLHSPIDGPCLSKDMLLGVHLAILVKISQGISYLPQVCLGSASLCSGILLGVCSPDNAALSRRCCRSSAWQLVSSEWQRTSQRPLTVGRRCSSGRGVGREAVPCLSNFEDCFIHKVVAGIEV